MPRSRAFSMVADGESQAGFVGGNGKQRIAFYGHPSFHFSSIKT
jgi:hypothetical protein